MHKAIAHNLLTAVQPVPEHDALLYGTSLCSAWVSCPFAVPSQLTRSQEVPDSM